MTPPMAGDVAASAAIVGGSLEGDGAQPTAAAWAADVSQLVRPRIALMVLATVVAAFWPTAGRPESLLAFTGLLVGTGLVAASSSIVNQILERDSDRLMPRTARRPLVAGRLATTDAWFVSAVTLIIGSIMIVASFGWAAAAAALEAAAVAWRAAWARSTSCCRLWSNACCCC